MKVIVLTSTMLLDYKIHGVFSSERKAKEYEFRLLNDESFQSHKDYRTFDYEYFEIDENLMPSEVSV